MRLLSIILAALLAIPTVLAFASITSGAFVQPNVETRNLYFWSELNDGKFVVPVQLDKDASEPILDISVTGYGVGNFTVWIEPVDGQERFMLLSSKQLVTGQVSPITGFVAGGNGKGNSGTSSPGKSGDAPGQSGSPGKSGEAPGKNKNKKSDTSKKSQRGLARQRLERFLNALHGFLKGESKREARLAAQREAGVLTNPVSFRSKCAHTCSLPKPMMYKKYNLVAEVDGKLEIHSLQYTVLRNQPRLKLR